MPKLTDPLLVITDLDGSLLDHHTYNWQPAAPWLAKLKANNIAIIICSSKTTAEIVTLQTQLGLIGAPFIAENGAALQLDAQWPNVQASAGDFNGKDYATLRAVMTRLREAHGYKFFGFGDLTADEVAELTCLSVKEALQAKTRQASETFIWRDTDEKLAAFTAQLEAEELAITEGGRFYHVMSRGSGKGAAVRWLVEQYRQHDSRNCQTIGLGDGPNDQSMLDAVNYAVIIRGYSKTPVALFSAHQSIYRTQSYGPEGWVEGIIANFHNLSSRKVEDLEIELIAFSRKRKMGLILPSLFSELEGPALPHIIDELARVPYLEEIVIGLDRADRDQFLHAREFFFRLPQHHHIVWNDGPRLKAIDAELEKEGLSTSEPGKGRNVWFCTGYTLASNRILAVAFHDCDIVTYERGMLARLLYPIVHPSFSYEFCKGFYARVAKGKMNGRVMRLLLGPLLRSLENVYGQSEYLDYLNSFRYPLSGEFAMRTRIMHDMKIPCDWGLEVGLLSEIYRNYSPNHICQVEIADNYDHKHQPLAEEDSSGGLKQMSNDIIQSLYRKLATMGVNLTKDSFMVLKESYYRNALDFLGFYHHDAIMNGLSFCQHSEETAVELFMQCILDAGQAFIERTAKKPFIPSWRRVQSALPNIMQRIYDAVEEDNKGNV